MANRVNLIGMSTIARIDSRISELEDLIAKHSKELGDLRTARRIVVELEAPEGLGYVTKGPMEVATVGGKKAIAGSTRELIHHVLDSGNRLWMTANEIRDLISELKGSPVPMSTVSPTLSDMKKSGLIARDNMRVALVDRVKREMGVGQNYPAELLDAISKEPSSPNLNIEPAEVF